MIDRPDQFKVFDGSSISIYPPKWYIDIVSARMYRRELKSNSGRTPANIYNLTALSLECIMPSVLPCIDSQEQMQLLAVALEILQPHCLDHLPVDDQAYVLGFDLPEVREYLHSIFEHTGVPSSAATLIIEDEAAVALDLVRIVRQTGHQVCGTAARLDQAVKAAARMRPALVLADVQLGDGPEAGIMAVREIRQSGDTPAVFVTAYPERVKDDAPDALVISKPYVAREIQTAMWRALYRQGHYTSSAV